MGFYFLFELKIFHNQFLITTFFTMLLVDALSSGISNISGGNAGCSSQFFSRYRISANNGVLDSASDAADKARGLNQKNSLQI